MPLMIGFCVVLLMLIVVVAGASKGFLVQRQLASAADAAALAGADGFDTGAVYTESGAEGGSVVLDAGAACAAARQSFAENVGSLPSDVTRMTACEVNGRTITLRVTTRAEMPVLNKLFPAAFTVNANASAQGRP